jgi:tetratricopeptide (TPR) repeat protein
MPTRADEHLETISGILLHAQKQRVIVQEQRPLHESLEWQLGQHYFQVRGNKGFINDAQPIPFLINNDGNLSYRAAELAFAAINDSVWCSSSYGTIFVLELGIGVGLFARFFLDRFQELSAAAGSDYYDRLCYVAVDRSKKMLLDAVRHGIFGNHAGRYVLRVADANESFCELLSDIAFENRNGSPFAAVFLNYLLDCLPAAVVQISGTSIRQLYVKTYLGRDVRLRDFTDLAVEELVALAGAPDTDGLERLAPLYGLFASEYSYREIDPQAIPFAQVACDLFRGQSTTFIHSFGAIRCLSRLYQALAPGGFILINDYGQTSSDSADETSGFQKFSGSSAIGVNFHLIPRCLGCCDSPDWIEPEIADTSLISRLYQKSGSSNVAALFREMFSTRETTRIQATVAAARTHVQQGRNELATSAYEEALRQQPRNWALMSEVGRFLTSVLRDPAAGLALSRKALSQNPCCSSEIWNGVGDSLFLLGRTRDAKDAFLRAHRVNPKDPRASYNIANCLVCEKHLAAALGWIAHGLAVDATGAHLNAFLKLQHAALEERLRREQQLVHLQVDRISREIEKLS